MPKMVSVQSSNISAVGYDPETKILTVQFKNARAYRYANVPEDVYESLVHADSPGGYFSSEIRDAYATAQV